MEDFFDYIDDYMAGSLSPQNKVLFEAELLENASFKAAVSNYQDARKLSEGLLEVDIVDTLTKLKGEDKHQVTNKSNSGKLNYLAIALLSVLALAIFWYFNKQKALDLDKDQVLASYIKPVDQQATKSVDTIGMTSFEKGKFYFALNRFEESEEWLIRYVSREKEKNALSRGYYWLGAAHLEQWELNEAKSAWQRSEEKSAKENLNMLE